MYNSLPFVTLLYVSPILTYSAAVPLLTLNHQHTGSGHTESISGVREVKCDLVNILRMEDERAGGGTCMDT